MSNNNNLITDIRWATFIHFIYADFYLFVYFFNENTFTVYLTGINKILLDLTPLNGKKKYHFFCVSQRRTEGGGLTHRGCRSGRRRVTGSFDVEYFRKETMEE